MGTTRREENKRLQNLFPPLRRLGEGVYAREIPVVLQATVSDCGAACVAMVAGYHGKGTRLDEVRASMDVGRDGVNARTILEAGAFHQLRGRGVRIEVDDLKHLPRASVLHWNFSHFVVFDRMDRKQGVRIIDPAFGRRTVPTDEVRKAFTGIALVFAKQDDFVPLRGKGSTVVSHLRRAISGTDDWYRIVFVAIFLQGLSLLLPLVDGRLVDRVVPRNDAHLLVVMIAALATVLVFHFLASFTRAQLMLQLRTLFDQSMTFGFIEHVLRLPYAFFERRQIGDLQMRVQAVAQIREALTGAILSGFIDGVMVLGHLAFLAFMSLRVTAFALGIVSVQIACYLLTRRRLQELAGNNLAKQADAANAMNELLTGMESLKASGTEQRASLVWANRYVDVMNLHLRQGAVMALSTSILNSLQMLGPMVLLIAGITEVMDKKMTLGVMLSANALATGFLQPVMNLVASLQTLQLTRAQLDRINDVRNTKPEQEPGTTTLAPCLEGAITLERVSFRYGAKLKLAVRDVTVNIAAGECVAIVGRSGSGKTTLGRLLLGLYEPSEGTVLLDGQPIGRLDLASVRRQFGVVVQRPHIFGSTIRANIALANPDAPIEKVREAALAAGIHDEIMRMPMQYETPVVAGGASLSGGQRQRIALARALVGDPAILLLDEATSSLDSITESTVQKKLGALRCTRIVIAHRLSTVVDADRILVMDDGALVEEGTHEGLLAKNGVYARLVQAQLPESRQAHAPAHEGSPRHTRRMVWSPVGTPTRPAQGDALWSVAAGGQGTESPLVQSAPVDRTWPMSGAQVQAAPQTLRMHPTPPEPVPLTRTQPMPGWNGGVR